VVALREIAEGLIGPEILTAAPEDEADAVLLGEETINFESIDPEF
jgi:hypothetical protein